MAARGPLQNGFYCFCKYLVRGALAAYLGVRYFDVPDIRRLKGGLLIASNHQSFFDPVLVGMALDRPVSYLARRSLFRVPGFRELIRALGAYPVTPGRVDSAALKTVLRLLRGGEALLMFPEGTRTRDGALGVFRPGVAAIAIRCAVPVLPVCIEGAYESWPRTRALPRPGRVALAYGQLLEPEGQTAGELTRKLRAEIERLQGLLRRYLGKQREKDLERD